MELLRSDDPRSPLDRARRPELVAFANANGMKDVSEAMPAVLIRKKLRAAGLVNINVPPRPLGPNYTVDPAILHEDSPTVDADEDLERQFEQARAQEDVSQMNIVQLRSACKARGIKMARTDTIETLRAKLNG